MTEIVTRMAKDLGTSVQYQDYYPMVELAYRYTYEKPLVRPDQLPHLQTQMRRLHEWYMQACKDGSIMIIVALRDEHYFRGHDEIHIEFEELFQLFNQDALDKSLVSCYCLMKMLECKRGQIYDIGFTNPQTVHEVTVNQYAKDTEENLPIFLVKQETKMEILFPYNFKVWKRFIKIVRGEWKQELTFQDYNCLR
nr:uncharacterized protein LOC127336738 [Lolium perenne]